MNYQNLRHLQDNLLLSQGICSWSLGTGMQLMSTNCPRPEFFDRFFAGSSCPGMIREHFTSSQDPVIVTDRIGFVWIAVLNPGSEENALPVIYLAGPVFTSEMTARYLNEHVSRYLTASETGSALREFIRDIPQITSEVAVCLAGILHYSAVGEAASSKDIKIRIEPPELPEESHWGEVTWHGTWLQEQRMFQDITEGRLSLSNKTEGRIGKIGGGDPLRQVKNEMIIFSVICSRASMLGGVSSEGAYNLSDYYLQRIEAARSVSEVQSVGVEMHRVFVQRVADAKAAGKYSYLVRTCMEYVETHVTEKIVLAKMAADIGYNENYVSRIFKRETEKNLADYINERKIHAAKKALAEAKVSLTELSTQLSFSSPSYFCSVFKRETGMTPMEYRETCRRKKAGKETGTRP